MEKILFDQLEHILAIASVHFISKTYKSKKSRLEYNYEF